MQGRFPTFPVGQEGTYCLKSYLREVGTDEWQLLAEFPITVRYVSSDEPGRPDDPTDSQWYLFSPLRRAPPGRRR